MADVLFRPAQAQDWPAMSHLLQSAGLPLEGARDHLAHFELAERDGCLIGMAGLEMHAGVGLLRSVAVAEAERGQGVGQALVRHAIARSRLSGLKGLVLLTETAPDFFKRLGFRTISRAFAPEEVKTSAEFQGACPDSAILMRLDLAEAPLTGEAGGEVGADRA